MKTTKVGQGIEFLGVVQSQAPAAFSPKTTQVLEALRMNVEGFTEILYGVEWRSVYLDNALARLSADGITPRAFAGHLGVLEKAGLYRPQDNGYGLVAAAMVVLGTSPDVYL